MQSFLQPAWKFIIFKHLFFGQVSHISEDLRDAYTILFFFYSIIRVINFNLSLHTKSQI